MSDINVGDVLWPRLFSGEEAIPVSHAENEKEDNSVESYP
jgi:hypothetical protein